MKGTFVFLGTGASSGVPKIGCHCSVCKSSSPFNQRLRTAGLVQVGGHTLLIDVGPDFRQQALKYKIEAPAGLLLTHTHYDHIAGVDELRVFSLKAKKGFPCLLSQESADDLRQRYYYFFRAQEGGSSYATELDLHILEGDRGETRFLGVDIGYMSYFQGGMKVNGFRIGDFAYISDIREYSEEVLHALYGVRKLVLSALRATPSHVHFSIDEAVLFARKVGAQQTRLTHLSHDVDYESVNRDLPPDVQLGYDGLQMEFTYK